MKLIKPSFEIIEQQPGLEGVYKQIEQAGRTCYKSEDKITEDSAKEFVVRMIKSGHRAMLEHGTVYLAIPYDYVDVSCRLEIPVVTDVVEKYNRNPYTKGWIRGDIISRVAFTTTNYRVLVENNWLDDLKYLCEPTAFHEKRVSVRFICDRGVSHEFVRHRVFSFAQESTRYCNYSKDKFNNEITFVVPEWVKLNHYNVSIDSIGNNEVLINGEESELYDNKDEVTKTFLYSLKDVENSYFELLAGGWKPQQARAVLPNALKTELVMTGFADDWWGKYIVIDKTTSLIDNVISGRNYKEVDSIDREKYRVIEKGFFPLRCSKTAHPQAQELAILLREEFTKRGI